MKQKIKNPNGGESLNDLFAQYSEPPRVTILDEFSPNDRLELDLSPFSDYTEISPYEGSPATDNVAKWGGNWQVSPQVKHRPKSQYDRAITEPISVAQADEKNGVQNALSLLSFAGCILVIAYMLFELVAIYTNEILICVLVLVVGVLARNSTKNDKLEVAEFSPKNDTVQSSSKNTLESSVTYNIIINHNGKGGENGI